MIVIENVCVLILRIDCATDTRISGAEVTVSYVRRQSRHTLLNSAATPRTILAMCCDNDPLFSEWMPTLFPRHLCNLWLNSTKVVERPRGMVNASRSLTKCSRGA